MMIKMKNRIMASRRGLLCVLFVMSFVFSHSALPALPAVAATSGVRVSFSAGGGKPAPAKQTLEPGERAQKPADMSKSGYSFTGWYSDSKKTKLYDFDSEVQSNTTLYAGWEKLPQVTFSAGGGKPIPAKQTIEPGERLQTLPEVSKNGYEFGGWYRDSKHTTPFYGTETINESVKLYAKWTKSPQVMFSGVKPVIPRQSPGADGKVDEPETPVKDGYIFGGWYTDSRKTDRFDFNEQVTGNLKLYAKWTAVPVVSFSAGGGKPAPAKQKVVPGGKVSEPVTPTKSGYTFEGWYTSRQFTQEYDFSKPVGSEKMTLYAKWVRNPVVSFSTKGKAATPPKQTLRPGDTVTAPSVSAQNYRLEGWYSDSSCKKRFDFSTGVEKSMTLYANFERTNMPTVSEGIKK